MKVKVPEIFMKCTGKMKVVHKKVKLESRVKKIQKRKWDILQENKLLKSEFLNTLK